MPRTLILIVVLALLGLPTPTVAQDQAAESAIRSIVAAQATAWNAGDATGYAAAVAPEVSFTNLFGMVMYGAPAFSERHRQILATFRNRRPTRRHREDAADGGVREERRKMVDRGVSQRRRETGGEAVAV